MNRCPVPEFADLAVSDQVWVVAGSDGRGSSLVTRREPARAAKLEAESLNLRPGAQHERIGDELERRGVHLGS